MRVEFLFFNLSINSSTMYIHSEMSIVNLVFFLLIIRLAVCITLVMAS